MKLKKSIAVLTAVSAFLCGMTLPSAVIRDDAVLIASAETSGTYGTMTYTLYSNYAVITGFDNSVTELEIPSRIEGLPVTQIGNYAFQNATKLKSVTIPDTVTAIGTKSFYNASALENITFSNSLKTIGESAFSRCVSLTEIVLPKSLTSFEAHIFDSCAYLQSVTIQEGVTSIPYSSFAYCTLLQEISLPLSISYISWDSTFKETNITDVYYAGSKAQWNTIENQSRLSSATVHYGAENPPKKFTPDINSDGTIDALDAAIVLQYAAYTGANGYVELSVFLAM
ncbi:MAG: leucine-rich repeat protein [Oscillospiraceae bacterium]|nr:leucine-rich repeat protein [Oscillospiraceae bacterium]